MTDAELMILKAVQDLAYQIQRNTRQMERIANIFETEQAEKEQRWYPEGYDDGAE